MQTIGDDIDEGLFECLVAVVSSATGNPPGLTVLPFDAAVCLIDDDGGGIYSFIYSAKEPIVIMWSLCRIIKFI